jgi:hypothetical protein
LTHNISAIGGVFSACFESLSELKSVLRQRLLKSYNGLIYSFFFCSCCLRFHANVRHDNIF